MQVHRGLEQLPEFKHAVVTIGTFDGVHKGHQQIISQLKSTAAGCDGETVIITFDPHPREVLSPTGDAIRLLNTLEEKICLLQEQQIDHLVVVPFTVAFSQQSAGDYIKDFLIRYFHPHTVIIGHDHRFGHNREGDITLLTQLQTAYHYQVQEIPKQVVHEIAVSSTRIRHYLQEGNITLANELLGYAYRLSGKVIHGDQLGRQLGYPTANIKPDSEKKLIPAIGVYAVDVYTERDPAAYQGMLNIGYRPTFGGKDLRIEVNIFDFSQDIYDSGITVAFRAFIRHDQHFSNAQQLIEQLAKDKIAAKR